MGSCVNLATSRMRQCCPWYHFCLHKCFHIAPRTARQTNNKGRPSLVMLCNGLLLLSSSSPPPPRLSALRLLLPGQQTLSLTRSYDSQAQLPAPPTIQYLLYIVRAPLPTSSLGSATLDNCLRAMYAYMLTSCSYRTYSGARFIHIQVISKLYSTPHPHRPLPRLSFLLLKSGVRPLRTPC